MTRYPSPTRALHQLGRHSSGTPGDETPAPELWTIAGFAEATRAAFTGPFWPLGEFPDTQGSRQETT